MTLVPHDAWWLGTFYGDDANRPFDAYVDVATPAVWHGEDLVRAVDLDLDVIRGRPGGCGSTTRTSSPTHRVSLGYPEEVIEQAITSCEAVLGRRHGRGGTLRRERTATGSPGCRPAERFDRV